MKIFSPILKATTTLTGTPQFSGSLSITGSASSLLSVNNSLLYVSSSGNIGIGTSTPGQLLEVVGGEIKAGRVDSSNEGGQLSFGRASDNATAWYIDAYSNAASPQLRFVDATAAAVRMTMTGSNVGIGTGTPATILHISSGTPVLRLTTTTQNTPSAIEFGVLNGGTYNYAKIGVTNVQDYDTNLTFWTAAATSTTLVERMRLTKDGALCVATTTPAYASGNRGNITIGGVSQALLGFQTGGVDRAYAYHDGTNYSINNNASGGGIYMSSNSGGVVLASGATSWASSSDERLKNINSNIEDALLKLSSLRTVNFSWKSDTTNKEVLGLIAQDIEQVFPQVIDRNKLPASIDNEQTDETEYLSVRYTELIPVLVAAIQELSAKNTSLEERLAILENK